MRPWLCLLAVGAAALAGCGSGGSEKVTTLSLWARSDESAFIQGVVDGFNRSHRDIKVDLTIIPVQNFVQKFGLASASGSGPDVASIDLVYLPFFASAGVLSDITAKARALPYRRQFDRAHVSNAMYQGKVYALPFSGDASVLFYNTDLFRKAGLDPGKPPKTWRDIEAYSRKVSASGKGRYGYYFAGACGGCAVFTFLPLIWASGGDILKGPATDQKPTLTSDPRVAAGLTFYRRLFAARLVPPQAQNDNGSSQFTPFESGKVAMFSTGSFGVATFKEDVPKLRYDVTPIPGQHGGTGAFAGGDEIAISKSSDHQSAAWEFLRWSTSAEVQDRYFARKGVVPVRRDVADRVYAPKGKAFRLLSEALFKGKVVYSVQENALINDSTGPWATMIGRAVFKGEIRPALKEAQSVMTNILSRG